MRDPDIVIVGGGLVGSALAYGLARAGARPLLLDGDDRDLRAARANFGLIWVQGKGVGMTAYQRLTRRSAALWPNLALELHEATGAKLDYRRVGGLQFCVDADEFEARSATIAKLASDFGETHYDTEMVERRALEGLLPGVRLGQDVVGASFCATDGDINPLRAFQLAAGALGARIEGAMPVTHIQRGRDSFSLTTPKGIVHAPRLVIAAGNGTGALAEQAGISMPLRPQRGQLLVTERLAPLLPLPTVPLRQTQKGACSWGPRRKRSATTSARRSRAQPTWRLARAEFCRSSTTSELCAIGRAFA